MTTENDIRNEMLGRGNVGFSFECKESERTFHRKGEDDI